MPSYKFARCNGGCGVIHLLKKQGQYCNNCYVTKIECTIYNEKDMDIERVHFCSEYYTNVAGVQDGKYTLREFVQDVQHQDYFVKLLHNKNEEIKNKQEQRLESIYTKLHKVEKHFKANVDFFKTPIKQLKTESLDKAEKSLQDAQLLFFSLPMCAESAYINKEKDEFILNIRKFRLFSRIMELATLPQKKTWNIGKLRLMSPKVCYSRNRFPQVKQNLLV